MQTPGLTRHSFLFASWLLACATSQTQTEPPAPAAESQAKANATADSGPPSLTLPGIAKDAQIIEDLGTHERKVSTSNAEAQAFFNQGLRLTFGFNHDEAARAFAKAAEIDPTCAMCFWGAAYTLGPNYNVPLLPDRAKAAWEAITSAKAQAANATEVERALVDALAKRFKGPEYLSPPEMQPFNEAYADAMRDVAKSFPDDLDVQVLAAEAMMNVNAWKLWTPEGEPAEGTMELVGILEKVLETEPTHPGANHYYIHAIEASKNPEKAEAAADRLGSMMPAAGHIVHMPAHIYQRVGRYADASKANTAAVASDQQYLEKITPPGYYPMYVGHNFGFLAYSASMEGRSATALEASRSAASTLPMEVVCSMPGLDFFLSEPLLVMVRFGQWEAIMKEPEPAERHGVLRSLWHHARGMALASTGKVEDAKAEHAAILKIRETIPEDLLAGLNSGRLVLELSATVLEAKIADVEKKPEAIGLWEKAVSLEDKLAYNEPSDWFYPTRHYLGAALLEAKRAKDAEAVYRKDLEQNPKNGWALFGVWKSLEAQRKRAAAKKAKMEFEKSWAQADVELTRSAF